MFKYKRSESMPAVGRADRKARIVHSPAVKIGAEAISAQATGAHAIRTLAVAAFAIGALAVGALVIGRLQIGRARVRCLEIDELVVRRLRILEPFQTPPDR